MHRLMTSMNGPLTNLPSLAIPTISQSHRESPQPKAQRKRHQRALTIASTQTTKLPQTNLRRTARPIAPQIRKANRVAAQTMNHPPLTKKGLALWTRRSRRNTACHRSRIGR
jgi:hypothetical protein